MQADIAVGGASSLKEGVPQWQASIPVGDETSDVDPFGEIQVFQALGIDSLPFAADESGKAELVILRDCGGRSAVCIGARETRNADFIGKMSPGDTSVHATGPKATAQCFLKNTKKQAGLAVDDAQSKTMLFLLDGKNKKAQWTARGAMIEITVEGDIVFTSKGGASLLLSDKVYVLGDLSLPGMTPGMALMQGPAVGDPTGVSPLLPVQGVGK